MLIEFEKRKKSLFFNQLFASKRISRRIEGHHDFDNLSMILIQKEENKIKLK